MWIRGLFVVPPCLFYLTTALAAPHAAGVTAPHDPTTNQFAQPGKAGAGPVQPLRSVTFAAPAPSPKATLESIQIHYQEKLKEIGEIEEQMEETNRQLAEVRARREAVEKRQADLSDSKPDFMRRHHEQLEAFKNRSKLPTSSNIQPAAQGERERRWRPDVQSNLIQGETPSPADVPKLEVAPPAVSIDSAAQAGSGPATEKALAIRTGSLRKEPRVKSAALKSSTEISTDPADPEVATTAGVSSEAEVGTPAAPEQTPQRGGPLRRMWNGVKNGGRRLKNKVKNGWKKLKAKFRRRQ